MLDLVSLQVFVRAVEAGSLSAASLQSHLAIAAVSRRISLLEEQLGVALLIRTGRGVEPTPAGQALVLRARNILQQEALTRSDLSDYAKGVQGAVSIMAATSSIVQHLPGDLAGFVRENPSLRLHVSEGHSAEIVAAVREGGADVGVIMEGPNVAGLNTMAYRTDRLVVVARASFQPGVGAAPLADFLAEDFVVMEDDTTITKLLSTVAATAGFALRISAKMGSFDAVCRMVQAGFGLGVLPRMAAQSFETSMGLRLIELEDDWAERRMLICMNPQHGGSGASRKLIAHLNRAATAA